MDDNEVDYRRLVENLGKEYFFYRHDPAGVMTFVSPSIERMLGYAPEAYKVHYGTYMTDDPVNALVAGYTGRTLEGLPQDPYEVQVKHHDGGKVWLEVSEHPLRDPGGKVVGVEGIARDITARKRAEADLVQALGLGATVLDSIEDHIMILDARDHTILDANRAFLDAYGLTREQVSGKLCSLITHGHAAPCQGAEESCPLPSLLGTGKNARVEHVHTTADGRERIVEVSVHPIKTRDGAIERVVHVSRDITERKRKDLEARNIQKLESLGVLAGGLAHDLNNIITVILGNLSLLRSRVDPGGESLELVDEAQAACTLARGLSGELLTFAKGGTPIAEVLDLRPLIKDAAAIAVRGLGARCVFAFGEAPLPAAVDKVQIARVVQNLIINAAQAMPGGGDITVRASVVERKVIDGPSPPAGRYVRLSVEDQGKGIAPALIAKIFDPYFSTKGVGRGLGLATCYSIMSKHGGHIAAELLPGAGTAFILHFPLADAESLPASPPPAAHPAGTGRILVMDDEAAVAKVLTRMIEHLGYRAATVRDGTAAIEACRLALGSRDRFDVFVLDLNVRDGMGGLEALAGIARLDPGAKVLVSSGYANDPVMAEFGARGFHGVLAKPYRLEEVALALRRALGTG